MSPFFHFSPFFAIALALAGCDAVAAEGRDLLDVNFDPTYALPR